EERERGVPEREDTVAERGKLARTERERRQPAVEEIDSLLARRDAAIAVAAGEMRQEAHGRADRGPLGAGADVELDLMVEAATRELQLHGVRGIREDDLARLVGRDRREAANDEVVVEGLEDREVAVRALIGRRAEDARADVEALVRRDGLP